jgi:type II secretory pathway pseudopilin PulG
MYFRKPNRSHSGESGYVLLALMLVLTLMLIAMSIEAPRIAQQIKRQKEEELVHRGKDYATAVKRFVHKNGGQYPLSVEQLENTNHIRFLRKKYIDPMTGESDWKLVHTGEAQITIPTANPGLNPSTQNPGLSGSTPGSSGTQPGSGGGSTFGGSGGSTFGGSGGSSLGGSGTFGGGGSTPPVLNAGSQTGAPNQQGTNGQLGSLATTGIGNGQTAGGGQIIGVASVSKGQAIKEFNDKDHYNEWLFVYDLRLEQSGGTGVTVAAPMAAAAAGGATGGNNPAGNANNPNGNNPNGGNNPNAGGNNQNLNNPSGSQPPPTGGIPTTPAPGATPTPN